jgi:signal transduction histidine kinase
MNTRDARRLSVLLLVLFVAILITMYLLLLFRQQSGEPEAFRQIYILLLVLAVAVVAGIFLTLRMLFGFERLQLGVLFHHPDPLFILGPDRLIRYANPAGELAAEGDYVRRKLDDVISLSGEGAPLKNQKMLRTGETVRPVVRHVDRIYSGRGRFLGEVHIFRDMTAWNRLAAEVRKKRELDLLAMMAASFAHEFNNSLAALSGTIELGLIADSELQRRGYLAEAKERIRQASIMTRELIAFGMGDGEGADVTVADEIGTVLGIVFDGIPEKCRVDLSSIDLSLKSRDKLALQVVLSQVLRNAVEAQAGNSELPVELVAVPAENTGDMIHILVHDRGKGLPDIDTEQLFEPFYSEKWNHKGLGLSFSRHLMEKMGGSVDLYPRPGGGTTVMIRLPVYHA